MRTVFSFFNEENKERQAIGAIAYRQDAHSMNDSLLHDFDVMILVICNERWDEGIQIEHLMNGNIHYQQLYVSQNDIERWVISGENRGMIRCFLHGQIIWDVKEQVTDFRNWIVAFKGDLREQRLFKEYAKFQRMYVDAKRYLQENDLMDAYHSVLQALNHYARIELIEQGILPENSVWDQAKQINSVVYKLIDELTTSTETLEKRVQLVLLASEFSVTSKMAECCSILLRILESRKEAWSIQDLTQHPDLLHVKEELPSILRRLVQRSLVKETTIVAKDGLGEGREIRYMS